MEEKKFIYLDHAATTAARPEVVEAMLPYLRRNLGIHQVYIHFLSRIRR